MSRLVRPVCKWQACSLSMHIILAERCRLNKVGNLERDVFEAGRFLGSVDAGMQGTNTIRQSAESRRAQSKLTR